MSTTIHLALSPGETLAEGDLPPCPAAPQFDALLQASRRVDWRFLLPEPNLGVVLYVGPTGGPLFESLRLFSASLTVADPLPAHGRQPARYTVAVVAQPSVEVVRRAVQWLRPGGWLYLEASRRSPPVAGARVSPGRPLRSVDEYRRAAEEAGLVEVQAFWHWPDFESCAEIIPLDDRAALDHALARRRSDPRTRLKGALACGLVRLGLLARLVPCFSILGQKEGRG